MLAVKISNSGKRFQRKFRIQIEEILHDQANLVSSVHLKDLHHIFVTDLPMKHQMVNKKAHGSYFPKYRNFPAYIEIYLKNIFRRVNDLEFFRNSVIIQSVSIARTFYHEIGHHVQCLQGNNQKEEIFAETYSQRLVDQYILQYYSLIQECFKDLENYYIGNSQMLDFLIFMKSEWDKEFINAKRRL
jgi:hypothetical protein